MYVQNMRLSWDGRPDMNRKTLRICWAMCGHEISPRLKSAASNETEKESKRWRGRKSYQGILSFRCAKSLEEGLFYHISRSWPSNAKLSSLHWNGTSKKICWSPFIVRDRGSVRGRGGLRHQFLKSGFSLCLLHSETSTDLGKNGHQQGRGSTGFETR